MRFGTAYYPELTPEAEWPRDLDLMRQHGIEAVRVFEFAWAALEPREGEMDWAWADRFLDLLEERHMGAVLCTPTATPPPWMTRQYPEMMVELRNGSSRDVGGRRDIAIDNPVYQQFCEDICVAMAVRWGERPCLLGWQLDNELCGAEFAPPESHTAHDQFEFRRWLKRQHGSINTLNERWGTRFWSQSYSDWGEVGTPRNCRCTHGHVLDYSRWYSHSIAAFVRRCRTAMRPYTSAPIGHNHTAVLDRGIDHQLIAEDCDVTGWDAYPGAAGGACGEHKPAAAALAHDWFRCMLQRDFWVWETAPCDNRNSLAFLAQMHAAGASWCYFWHWRAHRANVEQGCSTLLDFDGQPLAERLALLDSIRSRPELQDAPVDRPARREVAVILPLDPIRSEMRDYLRDEPRPPARSLQAVIHAYHACWRAGLGVDVKRPGDDLTGYRMIVLAGARLLADDAAAPIVRAVQAGAALVTGGPAAHLNEYGVYQRRPGSPLEALTGYTAALNQQRGGGPWQTEGAVEGAIVGDAVRIPEAAGEVVARFSDGPFAGEPAAISREAGRVQVAAGTGSDLWYGLVRRAAAAVGIATIENPYADVGSMPALDGETRWFFNHGNEDRVVAGVTIPANDFRRVPCG
jgi:beta-galactosidase